MFFKKEKNENNDMSKVAALLIHAAKIDENFSKSEEIIIKKALLQVGASDQNLEEIFIDKEGRFIVKDQLQKFSKLTKEIIFIGKGNHFEIWDKQLGEKHKIVSRSKFK